MLLFSPAKFWSESHKKLSKKWTSNKRRLCLLDIIFCTNWSIYPFFSLQLAYTINNFESILAAREKEYKRWFVKCFLNIIYFRGLEILHCSSFFTISNFSFNNWTIVSWPYNRYLTGIFSPYLPPGFSLLWPNVLENSAVI